MSPFPNFFLIGVSKAGTSSVYRYLDTHPQIFMSPVKEPRYFATDHDIVGPKRDPIPEDWAVTSLEEYRKLFAGVQDEKVIGEASACYMESRVAAQNIHDAVPDARLIAVLRDPVARSYSHFQMHVRARKEGLPRLQSDAERTEFLVDRLSEPFYVRKGQYHRQLSRYFDLFDRPQIKIFFFENLKEDPASFASSMYSFLDVDTSLTPEAVGRTYNKGGLPKSRWIQNMVKGTSIAKRTAKAILPTGLYSTLKWKVINYNQRTAQSLPAPARKRLIPYYEDDIFQLENELDVDLSNWLT
jgi:hypothetical protein